MLDDGSRTGNGQVVISYSETTTTLPQAIAFTSSPPVDAVVGGSYDVSATGGASGSPVTFTIDSTSTTDACSISGATVSFTGTGTCVINADQAGNATYSPAPQAQQTFTIGKAAQAITFTSTAPTDAVVGGSYDVTATGGASGNPVTFTIDSTSTTDACSSSGATVSFTGTGTCTINADQAGNATYNPAERAHQSFNIGRATITAVVSGTQTYGGAATFTVSNNAPAGVSLSGTVSCTAVAAATTIDTSLAAGQYTVNGATCSGLTASSTSNYTVSYAGAANGFVVSPVATNVLYTGQQLTLIGSSIIPSATLSSGTSLCVGGQPVTFSLDANPTTGADEAYPLASATADSLGRVTSAAINTSGWREGVYTITATFAGTTSCGPSSSSATFTVASPGTAAHGGGWYTLAGSGG